MYFFKQIQFLGVSFFQDSFYIVTEYIDNRNLKDIILNKSIELTYA